MQPNGNWQLAILTSGTGSRLIRPNELARLTRTLAEGQDLEILNAWSDLYSHIHPQVSAGILCLGLKLGESHVCAATQHIW